MKGLDGELGRTAGYGNISVKVKPFLGCSVHPLRIVDLTDKDGDIFVEDTWWVLDAAVCREKDNKIPSELKK